MPKFRVTANTNTYAAVTVEAADEEEAQKIAYDLEVDDWEFTAVDFVPWDILEIHKEN